jgi:nitrogen-specific signal transduction histidine kinase
VQFREEQRARRDAERSANAARALTHVHEAVLLLEDVGAVRYANPSAVALFGLGEANLESPQLRSLLDDDDRSRGPCRGS